MSQRLALATVNSHQVEVVAGFDRRQDESFLPASDGHGTEAADEMLYAGPEEHWLEWSDVENLVARQLDLRPAKPACLIAEVVADQAHLLRIMCTSGLRRQDSHSCLKSSVDGQDASPVVQAIDAAKLSLLRT